MARNRRRKGQHRNGIVITTAYSGSTARRLLTKINRSSKLKEFYPELVESSRNALRIYFLWIRGLNVKQDAKLVSTHFLLTKAPLTYADLELITETTTGLMAHKG